MESSIRHFQDATHGHCSDITKQKMLCSRDMLHSLLQNCVRNKDLHRGRILQFMVLEFGYEWNIKLGCIFISLYASFGFLRDAFMVFSGFREHSANSWTSIISAHAEHGQPKQAIMLFKRMKLSEFKPNPATFVSVLKSCTSIKGLPEGRLVHCDIESLGSHIDLCTGNTLIDMYCKCGSLEDARNVLDRMQARNVVSWNSMLTGYLQHDYNEDAIEIIEKMQSDGVKPSIVTLICQMKLCAGLKALDQGKLMHIDIYKQGLEFDVILCNALLNMYVKCNKLEDAHKVFGMLPECNVVTWSAIIHGYVDGGHGDEALKLFVKMWQKGIYPDEVTLVCVLKACANVRSLDQGMLIHNFAIENDLASSVYSGSVLVVLYTKCGSLSDGRKVFERLKVRNVVSWSSMIEAYAEQGQGEEALRLFKEMYKNRIEPNEITFLCVIKACTQVAVLGEGKAIHAVVIEHGLESELLIGNILVDMYSKCGSLEDAVCVFKMLPFESLESFSALITGYANHGNLKMAEHYFNRVCQNGITPDIIVFLSLLYACSHAGLLEEGYFHFQFMTQYFGVVSTVEHYACLVDMFGRLGLLEEAELVIQKMPFSPDSIIWKALLSSCVRHNHTEMGKRVFEYVLDRSVEGVAAYVLMSNISVTTVVDEFE